MKIESKVEKYAMVFFVIAPIFLVCLTISQLTNSVSAISGKVNLYVDVDPAIAITIQSSSDETTIYGNVNPEEQTVNGYTGYGVTEFGFSSAKTSLLPNQKNESMWSKITVHTNNERGYKLTVSDADDDTNLASESSAIPTGRIIQAGISNWAFMGGKITRYNAMTTVSSPIVIAESFKKSAPAGDLTEVRYGISTSGDQASGIYTDTIVYTATGEPTDVSPITPNDSEFLNHGEASNGEISIKNLGNNTYVLNGRKSSTANTSRDTVFIMLSEDIKIYEIQDSEKYKLLLYPLNILEKGDQYKFSVDIISGSFSGKMSTNNFRVNFRSLDKPDGGALDVAYDFVDGKYYGAKEGIANQRFSAVTVYIGRSQDLTFNDFTFKINLEKIQ